MLYKQKALSLDSEHPSKYLDVAACTCDPGSGGGRDAWSLRLAGCQSSPGSVRDPNSKEYGRKAQSRTTPASVYAQAEHVSTYNTHKHTLTHNECD